MKRNGTLLALSLAGAGQLYAGTWTNVAGTATTPDKLTIQGTVSGVRTNVGIGTSSPSAYLEVYGEGVGSGQSGIDLSNSVVNGRRFKITSGIKGLNEAGFSIMDRGVTTGTITDATRFIIDASGNVGIGASTPGAKFHVQGGNILLDNNRSIQAKSASGTLETLIYLTAGNNLYFGGGANTPTMAWDVTGNAASYEMLLNASGLGLGTTAIEASLHVAAKSPWIMLDRTDGAQEAGISFKNGTHKFWIWQDNSRNDLRFASSGLTGEDDTHPRMMLPFDSKNILANQSGGFFGIGQGPANANLVPDYPLHVSTANYKGIKLQTQNADSYTLFTANPTGTGHLVVNSNGGLGGIIFSTGNPDAATSPTTIQGIGKETARFTNAGQLGIGTTAPTSLLHLSSSDPWIALERKDKAKETGIVFRNGTHAFWMWQDNSINDLQFASSSLFGQGEDDGHPRLVLPADSRNIIANASGGYFGIGQVANAGRLIPEYPLHVSSANYKGIKLSTYNADSDVLMAGAPTGTGNLNFNSNGGQAGFRFSTGNPDVAPYGTELMRIKSNGNVGVGVSDPKFKLDVAGAANITGALTVASVNTKVWSIAPDYVFEKDYKLASLDHVESYVEKHKHLPEVPSAREIKDKGVDLAQMNMLLLKKVEELTLHAIRQEKEMKRQAEEIRSMKQGR